MGKKPLNQNQVKSLRKLVKDKPLHDLLLNLSVDLMLRSSDLLSLRVKDVMNESGSVKTEVKVKQKKTGKTTLNIPLSKNSIDAIKNDEIGGNERFSRNLLPTKILLPSRIKGFRL